MCRNCTGAPPWKRPQRVGVTPIDAAGRLSYYSACFARSLPTIRLAYNGFLRMAPQLSELSELFSVCRLGQGCAADDEMDDEMDEQRMGSEAEAPSISNAGDGEAAPASSGPPATDDRAAWRLWWRS